MAIDCLAIYTFGIIRTHSFQGPLGSSLLFGPGGQLLWNDLRIAGLTLRTTRKEALAEPCGTSTTEMAIPNRDKILSCSFSVNCVQKEPVSLSHSDHHAKQSNVNTKLSVRSGRPSREGLSLCSLPVTLERWFSAFPTLQPFNTVPHIGVTPSKHKIILLLLPSWNFATLINRNINI